MSELAMDRTTPSPTPSSGCGANQRCTAVQMMASDAPRIIIASKPLEKYSALLWP